MTYDSRETSAAGGAPLELYRFSREHQAWRYTSADRELIVSSQSYQPRAISRSPIESTTDMRKSELRITAPRDLEVADLWRISPPTLPVTFVLQEFHEGDGEVITRWTGRILSVSFRGAQAQISLEPLYTAMRRPGLTRKFQRGCAHTLYEAGCNLNREAFRVDGTADGIGGAVVTCSAAASKPDGWFDGGYLAYEIDTGIFERRFIHAHVGPALTLTAYPAGMTLGMPLRLYPGCAHTSVVCDTKFGNILNYGGQPYFTQKNPFGGDPMF